MTINTLPYSDELNFKYFYELSQIPRGSFQEKAAVDYIEEFLKRKSIWYDRDALGNVIARVPATPGRETEEPVILQAHTDMVCEKNADSNHDFTKDPIDLRVEDGWLMGTGTTLGADDGAGVANILAILDDPDVSHPPLECVFTVQEEDGMGGAKNLNFDLLKSRRMIGLDGTKEGSTFVSASSVFGGEIVKPVKYVYADEGKCFGEIKIDGLISGHGAINIGEGRANAIVLMGRLLHRLNKTFGIQIADLSGGSLVHVIPYQCKAVIAVNQVDLEMVKADIKLAEQEFKEEYATVEKKMKIDFTLAEGHDKSVAKKISDQLINLLYTVPAGVAKRNPDVLERIEGSWNMSIVKIEDDLFRLTNISRANYPASITYLKELVDEHAFAYDAEYKEIFSYLGYHVPEDSKLNQVWDKVCREMIGHPLEKIYIHAGIDAGMIFHGLGGIDVIVMMPTVLDVHTPNERMDVESHKRTYQYLKKVLEYI